MGIHQMVEMSSSQDKRVMMEMISYEGRDSHMQVVVVGVLCESAVEECPREVVDRVLLGLDGLHGLAVHDLCDNLRVEVVVEEVVEVRLNRERLVDELLVEF